MAFKMDYIVHGSMIENLDQPTSLHLCQDCVVYCFSCTEKKNSYNYNWKVGVSL